MLLCESLPKLAAECSQEDMKAPLPCGDGQHDAVYHGHSAPGHVSSALWVRFRVLRHLRLWRPASLHTTIASGAQCFEPEGSGTLL